MKYLTLLLLFVFNSAHAATPEACFEASRSYYVLLETGATTAAEKQLNRAADLCDFDSKEYIEKLNVLTDNDAEFIALYDRVIAMGLATHTSP